MKKILPLFFVVFSNLVNAQTQTVCPNTPYTYLDDGRGSEVFGPQYDDGSLPIVTDLPNGFTVIWPHNGTGYYSVINHFYEFLIHMPVVISSTFTFTAAPANLCYGTSGVYTVSDNCGTSFKWSITAGWTINGGGNTLTTTAKSVTITAPTAHVGPATLTVTSNTSGVLSKSIWLGPPVLHDVTFDGSPTYFSCDNSQHFTVGAHTLSAPFSGSTKSTTFSMSVGAVGGVTGTASGNNFMMTLKRTDATATVHYSNSNSCGTASGCTIVSNTLIISRQASDNEEASDAVEIYPNPANTSLNISIVPDQDAHTIVTLYDILGKAVAEKIIDSGDRSTTIEK